MRVQEADFQERQDAHAAGASRRRQVVNTTAAYIQDYKGKAATSATTTAASTCTDAAPAAPHLKRRKQRSKVSAVGFFGQEPTDADDSGEKTAILDELEEYLALTQMKFKDDWGVQEWWRENAAKFSNLEVMARQYLGCPSTSATVERLFSAVGISFSATQRRSSPDLVAFADRMFAHANMP